MSEYLRFLIILIATVAVTSIGYISLKIFISRITGRKKKYGQLLFKQFSKPLVTLIFLAGLYVAINSLSYFNQYQYWIDSIFYISITLTGALLISKILNISMGSWLKVNKGVDRTPQLLSKVVTIIIFIIAIIMILRYFKTDITPLVATLGVGGLAIGLALQSTLSNFFAGLHLISDRPITVGDYVELEEDKAGWVQDIGWRSTRIKTWQDTVIVIPNEKLANSTIVNDTKPKTDMSFIVECGVAYESDLQKVEDVTMDVARNIQKETEGAVDDFEPLLRYKEFGESNIKFTVILRAEEPIKRFFVTKEFMKALKKRYNEEGIEISWPIRKLYNIK